MDIIAQLLNMGPKEDEIANLSLQKIEDTALMAWQQHVTKRKPQPQQQANKVTAVKRKGQDPQFQQPQAGPLSEKSGEKEKGKSRRGNRSQAGEEKQKEQHKRQYANEILAASFAFHSAPVISPAALPLYQTTVDPCALSHRSGSTPYGEPAFPHTKNAI